MKFSKRVLQAMLAMMMAVCMVLSGVPIFAQAAVSELTLAYAPDKLTYEIGEELDMTGALLAVTYDDGTNETITPTVEDTSGFDSSKPGVKKVFLTIGDKAVFFEVTILEPEVLEAFALSADSLSMKVGETTNLTANAACSFKSSNTAVVKVSAAGKVTAVGAGSAEIIAVAESGEEARCAVVVIVPAEKIELNVTAKNVYVGKSFTLKATLTPADCTEAVSFSSSDKKIATVSKSGVVTGVKVGTAVITAKTASGKTAKCTVTVREPASKIALNVTAKSIYVGKSYTLKVTLTPAGCNDLVSFSSSDKTVATVSKSGKITGVKAGTAIITAKTGSGKKITCKVTVKKVPCSSISLNKSSIVMNAGLSMKLYANAMPENVGYPVVWSTSDAKICAVDGNGMITGIGAGVAIITATCGGKSAKCEVTVNGYTPGAFEVSAIKVKGDPNCYALKIINPSANQITIVPTSAYITDASGKKYKVTAICDNNLKKQSAVYLGNGTGAVGFISDLELGYGKTERVTFRFKFSGKTYIGSYTRKGGFVYKPAA